MFFKLEVFEQYLHLINSVNSLLKQLKIDKGVLDLVKSKAKSRCQNICSAF